MPEHKVTPIPPNLELIAGDVRRPAMASLPLREDAQRAALVQHVNRELRAERETKVQWMRAWMAYSQMHLDQSANVRSNLSLAVPIALQSKHAQFLNAYQQLMQSLSGERRTVLQARVRNLVKKTASPRITSSALGDWARFDTQKLASTCPFFRSSGPPVPEIQQQFHTEAERESQESLWTYDHISIRLKSGKVVRRADPFGTDEPYALSVTASLPPEVLSSGTKELTLDSFQIESRYHDAPDGISEGMEFPFQNSVLIDSQKLWWDNHDPVSAEANRRTGGIAAWSCAISVFEADAPERQALEEALQSTKDAASEIAAVAGFIGEKVPPTLAPVKIAALAVNVAGKIVEGVVDFALTLLSIFEDSDDFIGTWALAETQPYLHNSAITQPSSEERRGTVGGSGALYEVTLGIELEGSVRVHDQPDLVLNKIATEPFTIGKNAAGIPCFTDQTSTRAYWHFFRDHGGGTFTSAKGYVSWLEAGGAYPLGAGLWQPLKPHGVYMKRLRKGETTQIGWMFNDWQYRQYPYTADADGLLVWCTLIEYYTGLFAGGSGYVRYGWTVEAEMEIVR